MQAKSTTFIAIIMTTENREPSISLLFFIWIYIIIEDSDSTLTKYSLFLAIRVLQNVSRSDKDTHFPDVCVLVCCAWLVALPRLVESGLLLARFAEVALGADAGARVVVAQSLVGAWHELFVGGLGAGIAACAVRDQVVHVVGEGDAGDGVAERQLISCVIIPLRLANVEGGAVGDVLVLRGRTGGGGVGDDFALEGVLLAGVGGVAEVDHVGVDGRWGTADVLGVELHKVDLDLRDGEVGELHQSVLQLAAAAGGAHLAGVDSHRASGEGPAEHVGELESEEGGVVGDGDLDHLVVGGGVLRASGGGVVSEGADAVGAVVAGVAAVADAALCAVLVPELVVGAVEGRVVLVDLGVGEALAVAGAAVGAGAAAAATALEALEAAAETGGIIAGAAAGALDVGVGGRGLGVQGVEGLRELEVAVGVREEEASWGRGDDVLGNAVVVQGFSGGGSPRGAVGARAEGAVTSAPALLAVADVGGTAGTVTAAAAGASSLGDSRAEREGEHVLHNVVERFYKESKEKKLN